MTACIVPGCERDALNNLGVRLRRPDTSAIWAPNTEAFVCDVHATSGARINVFYEATEAGDVEISVHGSTHEVTRTTEIRRGAPASTISEALADRLQPG